MSREELIRQVRAIGPWHQNIRIAEDFTVMDAYSEPERKRENNNNISLLDMGGRFKEKMELLYPDGLAGKRFLDCACNAGGYCFWANELGAEAAFGFDAREHWIDQAKFVQENRTIGDASKVQFQVCDLMKLPELDLPQADFTLFKGIFYHLADPIKGLKIAADLTKEVLLFNSARMFGDNTESLYCTFEAKQNLMSGVHSLSWLPSGPSVIAKMLYWLGFNDIRHCFSKQYEDRPGFGRMELIAARQAGALDSYAEAEGAGAIDISSFKNAQQATEELRELF